jgi:hypothetical protein
MTEQRKGMLLSVYRNAELGDCTNGGITSRCGKVVVTTVREGWIRGEGESRPLPPDMQVFTPTEQAPEVELVIRDNGCVRWLNLEPAADGPADQTPYMAGGNYAGTTDSRWNKLVGSHGSLVSVHDRTETWDQYDALSR